MTSRRCPHPNAGPYRARTKGKIEKLFQLVQRDLLSEVWFKVQSVGGAERGVCPVGPAVQPGAFARQLAGEAAGRDSPPESARGSAGGRGALLCDGATEGDPGSDGALSGSARSGARAVHRRSRLAASGSGRVGGAGWQARDRVLPGVRRGGPCGMGPAPVARRDKAAGAPDAPPRAPAVHILGVDRLRAPQRVLPACRATLAAARKCQPLLLHACKG